MEEGRLSDWIFFVDIYQNALKSTMQVVHPMARVDGVGV